MSILALGCLCHSAKTNSVEYICTVCCVMGGFISPIIRCTFRFSKHKISLILALRLWLAFHQRCVVCRRQTNGGARRLLAQGLTANLSAMWHTHGTLMPHKFCVHASVYMVYVPSSIATSIVIIFVLLLRIWQTMFIDNPIKFSV